MNTLYTLALTRMMGFTPSVAFQLYQELGSGTAVYEHRNDIREVLPEVTPRLAESLRDWSEALMRAEAELKFIEQHHIKTL